MAVSIEARRACGNAYLPLIYKTLYVYNNENKEYVRMLVGDLIESCALGTASL